MEWLSCGMVTQCNEPLQSMHGCEECNKEKFLYFNNKCRGLPNIINNIIITRWMEVGTEKNTLESNSLNARNNVRLEL